jgi:biopolymer transport protein ExbD
MRVPSNRHYKNDNQNSTMTPMIDVVFLLLIFFVCASTGQVAEHMLSTDLSGQAVESDQPPPQRPQLSEEVWLRLLSEDGSRTVIELNNRVYRDFDSLKQTLTQLAGLAPEIPVILDVAPAVPIGDVVSAYDVCRAANFNSVNFAIDPGEDPFGARDIR